MISFPPNPSLGDSYNFERMRFVFDSNGWTTTGQPFLYVNEDGAISFDGGVSFGDSANVIHSRGSNEPPLWFNAIPDLATAQAGLDNTQYMTPLRTFQAIGQPNVEPIKTALNTSSSPPIFGARAWVNFNGTVATGTYTQDGNIITITITSHGLTTGFVSRFIFTTGTAVSGTYVVTVTDANTITIVAPDSKTTSGNVTRGPYIRSSGNVSEVTRTGVGAYTITWATPMPDAFYSYSHSYSNEVSAQHTIGFFVAQSTTTLQIAHYNAANSANTSDKSTVCVIVHAT